MTEVAAFWRKVGVTGHPHKGAQLGTTEESAMTITPRVREQQLTIYTPEQAGREWSRLTGQNSQLAILEQALPGRLGVSSVEDLPEPQFFGTTGRFVLDGSVPQPEELSGTAGEVHTIESGLIVQSRSAGNRQVAACVATTRGIPSGVSHDYVFVLDTTSDQFLAGVNELTPDADGHLVTRDGWWEALTSCFGSSDCGSTCLSAALTCPPAGWAVYLACLAGRCGGCVVSCAACATCDCTWWCRPAVGCCNN
ncbi:hypothetical protein [Streptomyces sp. Rer75]|uniref:hypothetical protein n=1 Tax=unclassified Streptomyces TaxID=2593676 RepID=UPI0015CFE58C|nr:hypothetical protein [Streptomyces sp. Rer75]QLH23604.1 hypothetical protein HYQ63_25725 [Streptomyces sp. Rer75]